MKFLPSSETTRHWAQRNQTKRSQRYPKELLTRSIPRDWQLNNFTGWQGCSIYRPLQPHHHLCYNSPNSKKQKDKNKETETEPEDICAVCDEPILEWSETSDGQEAIFCEGRCNAWMHRKCSGLSSTLFNILSNESKEPYRCCHCIFTRQRDEINILKQLVESLTEKISSLESNNSITSNSTSKTPNLIEANHSITTSETPISNHNHLRTPSSGLVEPPKAKSDKLFNVVMYGIKESQPNSSRATRLPMIIKLLTLTIEQLYISLNFFLKNLSVTATHLQSKLSLATVYVCK